MQIYPALTVSSLSAAWPFWEPCQAAAAAGILLLFICRIPHGKTRTGQAGNLLGRAGGESLLVAFGCHLAAKLLSFLLQPLPGSSFHLVGLQVTLHSVPVMQLPLHGLPGDCLSLICVRTGCSGSFGSLPRELGSAASSPRLGGG